MILLKFILVIIIGFIDPSVIGPLSYHSPMLSLANVWPEMFNVMPKILYIRGRSYNYMS